MYITPCGNLYSMCVTYIATTLDVHPFATLRLRIYDYIYNKLIFFVFSVFFFTTTCNIKYYYQLMNFYKDSLFSHSLKVLNELSISCSNKT